MHLVILEPWSDDEETPEWHPTPSIDVGTLDPDQIYRAPVPYTRQYNLLDIQDDFLAFL